MNKSPKQEYNFSQMTSTKLIYQKIIIIIMAKFNHFKKNMQEEYKIFKIIYNKQIPKKNLIPTIIQIINKSLTNKC